MFDSNVTNWHVISSSSTSSISFCDEQRGVTDHACFLVVEVVLVVLETVVVDLAGEAPPVAGAGVVEVVVEETCFLALV